MHSWRELSSIKDIPVSAVSDSGNAFCEVVSRCASKHGGIIFKLGVGSVSVYWSLSELKYTRDCMEDLVAAFAELRALSTLPHNLGSDDAKIPQIPFSCLTYPCIGISSGTVILTRNCTDVYVNIDLAGPPVYEARSMCDLAMSMHRQIILTSQIASSLSYAKQYKFEETYCEEVSGDKLLCYLLVDASPVQKDIKRRLTELCSELLFRGEINGDKKPLTDDVELPDVSSDNVPGKQLASHSSTDSCRGINLPNPLQLIRPYSERVLLTEDELRAQFSILDINANGWISRDELLQFFDQFDDMGVGGQTQKMKEMLRSKNNITFNEFCIIMLKMAQD